VSDDVDGDILLHKSVVEAYGAHAVLEGTTVEIDVIQKVKGLQARKVYSMDERTASKGAQSAAGKDDNGEAKRPRREIVLPESAGPAIEAYIKWFSRPKGFGFAVPMVGGPDIFVHMDVLRRCGIRELRPNQRVEVRITQTERGSAATEVTLLPEVVAAPRPIRIMAPAEFEARP
jgi:CspA family cold shock protein